MLNVKKFKLHLAPVCKDIAYLKKEIFIHLWWWLSAERGKKKLLATKSLQVCPQTYSLIRVMVRMIYDFSNNFTIISYYLASYCTVLSRNYQKNKTQPQC